MNACVNGDGGVGVLLGDGEISRMGRAEGTEDKLARWVQKRAGNPSPSTDYPKDF